MSTDKLDKIAEFEDRMSVVERDNPDLAEASRVVHSMLVNARHVAESVFNDDVASRPEVVMQISAAIADELDEMKSSREGGGYEDEDEDEDE